MTGDMRCPAGPWGNVHRKKTEKVKKPRGASCIGAEVMLL